MITSSTDITIALKANIEALLTPVKVYSFVPPIDALRYVYLTQLSENQINEKRAFLSQGFISIQVVEKFIGRNGNLDYVSAAADLIMEGITPTRLSKFAATGNINIFTNQFEAIGSELLEIETGRVAIQTLRLEYKFNKI
jgi:hypothetical protein